MQFPARFGDLPEYAFPRLRRLLAGIAPGGPEIAMSIGEPQHAVPGFVMPVMAEHAALLSKYPPNEGIPQLREAISDWLARRYGVAEGYRDPETQILPLNGTREGLFNACLALSPEVKNGAKPAVLLPNPFYQCYAVAALALSPLMADDFTVILLIDLLVSTLFAVTLHFIMGVGGMVSFGHAAYLGLGAYGAALAVSALGLPMEAALFAGPLAGALGALVFGWFCVRLSGVYFAMLTLAAAQIVWGIVYQWQDVTGGDDGILGVWPSDWARSDTAYFYLAFVLCLGGVWLMRRAVFAPFGYVLRGGRDSPLRAEAIGIDLKRHQWLGFTLSGAVAGLAGAVFAFSKGSVFPDALAISTSVDGLVMVLLGGIHALLGPILGAGVFVLIEDWVSRLDYWRAIFGAIILFVVLVAPDGIAGGLERAGRLVGVRR